MNMASMCILCMIFAVISINMGHAKPEDFPSLECKAENLGQYGRQSMLECVIKNPKITTTILMISWRISKTSKAGADRALLVFRNGEITKQEKGFSFAQPSWNGRNMNVSLLITNTAVEHHGRYTCHVLMNDNSGKGETRLIVTAKYNRPTIVSSPKTITLNTDGILTCETDGGYPKGTLHWFDEHNELTSDAQTEATQTDGGLFQLSRKLVVGKGSPVSKYTCSVFNASGGQEEESTPFQVIDAPQTEGQEQREELDTATKIVAPVVVIGSLIAGLLLALLIYRRRSQKIRRPSTTPLMHGHVGVPVSEEEMMEKGDDKYPDNVA